MRGQTLMTGVALVAAWLLLMSSPASKSTPATPLAAYGQDAPSVTGVSTGGSVTTGGLATTDDPVKPFPLNRVRDFYAKQAAALLDAGKPIPELLPQFPGLDGGSFGHWGQNGEERSVDRTLNSIDTGNVVSQVVNHFGRATNKGVAVRIATSPDRTVLFDPQRMTFTDLWSGGFVRFGENRFGVMGGVTALGQRVVDFTDSEWLLPDGTPVKYEGFSRHGLRIAFRYRVGNATVLDSAASAGEAFVRMLELPEGTDSGLRLKLLSVRGDEPTPAVSENGDSVRWRTKDSMPNKPALTVTAKSMAGDLTNSVRLTVKDSALMLDIATGEKPVCIRLKFTTEAGDSNRPTPGEEDSPESAVPRPSEVVLPAPGQWTGQTVITQGRTGTESGAYAIDTLTVPYTHLNPFGSPMRLAGVGSLADGSVAVCSIEGDVWLVTGIDDELRELKWQRIAAGLYQPLGLVVQENRILVLGRDQVTRLHDLNGDGETDFYECVTNDYPTTPGHDFCTSLQQDASGRMYWHTAAADFGLTRYASGTRPESLGNGLRNCNGIGVSPDGQIALGTCQEGTWAAASAIFEVKNHSYHGHPGAKPERGAFGYDLPMCFIPRGIDHSCGELSFLPYDARLGPLAGQIVGTSFGNCSHYVVLRDVVNGRGQGTVVPLAGDFASGICRLNFNRKDGHLYVAGTEGWQSYGMENGALQRIRYTGKKLPLPTAVEARRNGLLVRLNTPIDPASARLESVFCQQWNYLYSGAYGSPELSVKDPARQGHDSVPVKSIHALSDGRSVFLEIPELHPVMQFHSHLRLRDVAGNPFVVDAYSSLFELGEQFTEFPGHTIIPKKRAPAFPVAEKFETDPRLVKQESLGTNFGWVTQTKRLSVTSAAGMQFEPRILRIAPGSKVALNFRNVDPSMPHNIVAVRADRLEVFGQESMMLASNPRAIATHYVPQDPAEICFSPILSPGDQYTIFFEAPQESGEFKLVCTYPGHWRVMQGSLFVIPDNEPLPASATNSPTRKFVKNWTLEELATAADSLRQRNHARGKAVFEEGGCVKCHRIKDEGVVLGPDLTPIADRFRGTRLLQHILEPSLEINKQYQTWIASLADGRNLAGLLVEQDANSVTLLPNPLQPSTRTRLARSEIEELVASPQSTMPTGLLMVFERDEILDLLAFIQAGGDSANRLFRP